MATPKLLLKDHQPCQQDGSYKTWFIVPADGFMAGFGKMVYLGLKRILDQHNVVYMNQQVDQSYSLKEHLEAKGFKKGKVTIASLDVVKMYPSMWVSLLHDAVEFFMANLPQQEYETAQVCLDMLHFGMTRMFLTFSDKYYHYTGSGLE